MMESGLQKYLAIAAILTLSLLSGSINLTQAALNTTPPEPLSKLGTLPPKSADGPYQHWQKRQKYFLVVAVNDTGLPNTTLPFTLVDAQAIVTALTAQGYQPLDPDRPILSGTAATRSAIIKTLKTSHRKKDKDLVLLYFTGHGKVGAKDLWLQTYGQDEVATGQGVALSQLVIQTRTKEKGLGFTGELTIILDTCYSGSGMLSQTLNLHDLGKRLTIFSSSATRQESFPLTDPTLPKMSAFTYALLQAMGPRWGTADSDGDGMLRYGELYIHTKNQLKTWAHEKKVAQLMEPTLLNNSPEGFLSYQREQVRVWHSSYRQNLTTKEMNAILAAHLQTLGTNPKDKPELPKEAQALAEGLDPDPQDFYTQAIQATAKGQLENARALFAKADQQSRDREQTEQTKRHDLYLARARMESYDGKFTEAFSWYLQAANLRPPNDLELINEIGIAGIRAGNYPEAEPYLKQAAEQREQRLAPDDPVLAVSLNNLALLYKTQGKYADAEPLYLRPSGLGKPPWVQTIQKLAFASTTWRDSFRPKGSTPTPSPSISAS